MKRIFLLIFIFILSLFILTGCVNLKSNKKPKLNADKSYGDCLPEFNGDYAYLHVELISKDSESKTMKVKVINFDSSDNINVGDISVGVEGTLDCSDLLLFPPFKEGKDFIISYKDENQIDLPLRIYSIESINSFNERLLE